MMHFKKQSPILIAALAVAAFSTNAIANDAAVDVQALVNDAIKSGATEVRIPSGVHKIAAPAKGNTHLTFAKAKNLTIDGTGATLVFADPLKNGIVFNDCENLTFKGVSLDYDPLPFTQGKIVEVGPTHYDLEVHKGYVTSPDMFAAGGGGRVALYTYEPQSRLLKPGAWDMYPSKVDSPREGVLRIHFASPSSIARNNAVVGDLLVLSRRAAGAVRMNRCTNSSVQGVNVWAAAGIAIQEAHGEGGNRFSFNVTYGPTPAGATEARLHSANADGFHSASVAKGPLVENCLFEGQGDDAIAIHGTYSLVTSPKSSSDKMIVSPKFEMNMLEGDAVRILDGSNFGLKSTAKITSIKEVPAPEGAQLAEVAALWERYKADVKGRKFYELSFDTPVESGTGDLISSFGRSGAGYVVRNNTIRNHRARGILIKAGNGLVENNTVDNTNIVGIVLGPEISIWLGADFVQDTIVRGNTVRNVGRGANGSQHEGNILAGAISVHAAGPNNTIAAGMQNQRITIENNTIENTGGIGLVVVGAKDISVKNNTIRNVAIDGPVKAGRAYGIDPTAAVYVNEAEGVTFENNTVDLGTGHAKTIFAKGGKAHVVNADNGIQAATKSASAKD